MKTSNYIIYLYIPETDEYYLVHGYTGAVDKVEPEIVKYLAEQADPAHTFHIKDLEMVRETLKGRELQGISENSIDTLKQRGYLTDMTTAEERYYVAHLADFLHRKKVSTTQPGMMFIPSYECNLRCPYCFEADTRVQLGKMKVLQNIMTTEMVDAAYKSFDILVKNRFPDHPEYAARLKHSVTLYGGEPLMLETLPVVEYMLEVGLNRGYRFGAITNAVDLHHFTHLLGPEKINFLQITLDGTKDVHDRTRIGPRHKKGTYDRIISNIRLALEARATVSVRFHVDFKNVGRTQELEQDLKDEGFNQYDNFQMYTYPIHKYHNGVEEPVYPLMGVHHMRKALDPIYDNLIQIQPSVKKTGAESENGKKLNVSVPDEGVGRKLKSYVQGKLMGLYSSNMEPCGATTGLYIFDPFWKIYTCWDSVGIPGHETGRYSHEGPALNHRNDDWLKRSPGTIKECTECKYAFFHFGGCASLPVGVRGTIFGPACYQFEDNFIYSGQKLFRNGVEELLKKEMPQANPAEAVTPEMIGAGTEMMLA